MDHQDPRAELKRLAEVYANARAAVDIPTGALYRGIAHVQHIAARAALFDAIDALAASVPAQPVAPIGGNTGHGHVWPRPDGVKARCGGPAMCKACALDAARYAAPISQEVAMEQLQREAQERGQYGPLKRGATGVCSRSECICEREGLGDECIWLRPTLAAQAVAQPVAPAGWKLVPIEPNEAMVEAIAKGVAPGRWPDNYGKTAQGLRRESASRAYCAALAAAPTLPQAAAQEAPACSPTLTECPRCKNVIGKCDGGAQEAPAEVAQTAAARDVLAERRRQIEAEGWTPEHDDEHDLGELAAAASSYALAASDQQHPLSQGDGDYLNEPPPMWLWEREWWKPGTPRRMLVKSAALALAAIEQIDRALAPTVTEEKR